MLKALLGKLETANTTGMLWQGHLIKKQYSPSVSNKNLLFKK